MSVLEALKDLLDFRHAVYELILNPVETYKAYLPPFNAYGLFGGDTFSPEKDIPDLSGKVILVTGGNAGLGLESIRQLVTHGPKCVYLASRTPSKGEEAVAAIKKTFPLANIVYLPLDLASFDSISNAAEVFTSKSDRLNILMNNAGVMALPPGTTKEGYEIQLGTNYVGHALLTKLLMPTLLHTAKEPAADVRVINLSSESNVFASSPDVLFDKSKLDAQTTMTRYGYSKLASILFTQELAKRYPTITSVAVHPGLIVTGLWDSLRNTTFIVRWFMVMTGFLTGTSIEVGARNQLWAATCKKGKLVSGGFYKPVGYLSMGGSLAQETRIATDLWEWTDKELEKNGFRSYCVRDGVMETPEAE